MVKQLKVYLAGPLFTKHELQARREEAKLLRDLGFEVYNPLEQNDEIGFDLDRLYQKDIEAMNDCDFCVLCIDNYDSGTMVELGWLTAKGKPVYSVWSNWKYEEPDNLFVRGMAFDGKNRMFKSFEELLGYVKRFI